MALGGVKLNKSKSFNLTVLFPFCIHIRKYAFLLLVVLLPLPGFAGVSVSWMPQVGIGYTWAGGDYVYGEPQFYPGFSGGVMAEIRLMDWLGIKIGIEAAQIIVQSEGSFISWDSEGNELDPIFLITREIIAMAQIPVIAMFYLTPADNIQVYAGIGAMPSIKGYVAVELFDLDGKELNEYNLTPSKYYTAFIADAGVHWNLGPGKMTVGMTYTFYDMSNLYWNVLLNNVRVYTGYLF